KCPSGIPTPKSLRQGHCPLHIRPHAQAACLAPRPLTAAVVQGFPLRAMTFIIDIRRHLFFLYSPEWYNDAYFTYGCTKERAKLGLTGMEKRCASFYGMALMALAAHLITFARTKTRGIVRGILSVIAYGILVVSTVYMLLSII